MNVEPAWQAAPGSLSLNSNEVHVWRAGLDVDPATLDSFIDTLSADELARAERFHSSIHRNHFIAAHGTLRTLLSRYLAMPPGEFVFTQNSHGKPSLAIGNRTTDLRFNISHSQNAAVFAFVLGQDIGVDVEYIRPSKNERALAKRFFSAQEVAELESLPASEQPAGFFRCWTRKEAYIKARGGGLSINLSSFSVPLDSRSDVHLAVTCHDGSDTREWRVRAFNPAPEFAGAVAAEGKDWSVALWDFAEGKNQP